MTEPRDTSLIQRCLEGDVDSYGEIVDRYGARLINLATMMIGSRHDAEDIAQEAFVRAYRALGRFEGKSRFSSWLYQIALNLCKDHLKARSRHAKSIDEDHLEGIEETTRKQAPRQAIEVELSETMRRCVARLPYLYREAFVLRHLHGEEYEEVALATRTTADTARVRAHRAREMLREMLSPQVDTYWREKAAKEK